MCVQKLVNSSSFCSLLRVSDHRDQCLQQHSQKLAASSTSLASSANYRQDAAKRQTDGIKFTHRPKIRFFAPQGRLVSPIHVKLGRADGLLGPLGCAKFHLNCPRGGNAAPKISKIKFSLFARVAP